MYFQFAGLVVETVYI